MSEEKAEKRREFIKGIIGLAAAGVFMAGYWDTLEKMFTKKYKTVTPDKLYGAENVRVVHSSCLGCNVRCGIRAKVVKKTVNGREIEVVERIEGNPYHVYNRYVEGQQVNRYKQLPYNTPIKDGLKFSGTLCPRGVDGIHYLYDPYRVIKPLKRVGPRGSGKWEEITWEQLINELINGGEIKDENGNVIHRTPALKDLYVYGVLKNAGVNDPNTEILSPMKDDVDAIINDLKEGNITTKAELDNRIQQFKTKWNNILSTYNLTLSDILIDPDRPDLGTKANQIVVYRGRGQGHADYIQERFIHAIGSKNWLRHTSSCQLAFYAGNYLSIGYTDINPDAVSAKVLIMAGAQMGRIHPGATGHGVMIERASKGELKVYYVNPVAPRTTANGNIIWVPIKPGTDAALAMALLRWMFENNKYNEEFLKITNETAANNRGEPVATNATWLVITEEGHEREGEYLKDTDLGLGTDGKPIVWTGSSYEVYDSVETAELFHTGTVTINGSQVQVKTVLQILKDRAFEKTIEEWGNICGIDKETIEKMAKDFADAGRQAATYIHRGAAMHPNGEYNVWAYRALDIIVGNYHRKGGLMGRAGHLDYNKKAYNLDKKGFGEPVAWGPTADRHKVKYEDYLEYWSKKLETGNGYPAKRPWYPHTPEESYTEFFAGVKDGYPYPIKALFLYYANPVLSANRGTKFIGVLKDQEKLPLFVAITTTINETFMYADYIVPDTTYLETGTLGVQYLYASSGGVVDAAAVRTPVIMPLTTEIPPIQGDNSGYKRYASMFELFIELAVKLGTKGFGENGIAGTAGGPHDGETFNLYNLWDYIMRIYANTALDAQSKGYIPTDIPDEEVEFVENNYPIAQFKGILPENEWRAVAYMLARGGVFASYEESFDENGVSLRSVPSKRKTFKKTLFLWNEDLAKTRNSITGEKFYGGPRYFELATYAPVNNNKSNDRWTHGTPLRNLYPETEYPFTIVIPGSPLFTKHRSLFYYWVKQVMPENFAVIHPEDAKTMEIETGDIIEIQTPHGKIKVKAVVEASVAKGVIAFPVGMGRWADTLVAKPDYIEEMSGINMNDLPDKVEISEDAVNPVKQLDELTKELLFTKSPKGYYDGTLVYDKWRFNGFSPNPVMLGDPSLDNWPMLSWIGAAQVYFSTVAKITGKIGKSKIESKYNIY